MLGRHSGTLAHASAISSRRKLLLVVFVLKLVEDLVVAAVHLMRHAPDVDRCNAAERADVNDWRVRARYIAAPLPAVTEQGDSADLDVDALGHVEVDIAEASKDGHDRPRVVDLGFTEIQVKIPKGADCQCAAPEPHSATSCDMTEQRSR